MPSFRHLELPISGVQSLAWQGDELVDWIGSANRYGLDGSRASGHVYYGYRFDSVARSPCGSYTILYERRGTKGIVLRDGAFVREIDRSFNFADSFDYPIALFDLPDGRPAIAHCPQHHARLDIDLLETGERLTVGVKRELDDVFHSGLVANASGTMLLSAGWIWHPAYVVSVYGLSDALDDPALLDSMAARLPIDAEFASAVFLDDDRIALAANPDAENLSRKNDPDLAPQPGTLSVYRITTKTWESCVRFDETAGVLHAVDAEHVLALHQHPRLVHLPTGRIVERWPQIATGGWAGCLDVSGHDVPPLAWDAANKRLAVGTDTQIHVLSLAP